MDPKHTKSNSIFFSLMSLMLMTCCGIKLPPVPSRSEEGPFSKQEERLLEEKKADEKVKAAPPLKEK